MKHSKLTFIAVLGLLAVLLLCQITHARRQQAERILDATGVKGGLIVHAGCGDGRLTAALAANDGYLVHGLDRDPANVAKAREHIDSLGLYGKVSIARLRSNHLPYIDNLVNLIVTEDIRGIQPEELMRVLAPGGAVCAKKSGQWQKTVKPRPGSIAE